MANKSNISRKDILNPDVANQIVKQRRRPDSDIQVQPGDNAKFVAHSLKLAKLTKVDMSNAEAVAQRVNEYFEIVISDDAKASVTGLALALGIDRVYLWELKTGHKGKSKEVANILKRAYDMLELQTVEYMQNGKINPVTGIFFAKNWYNYTDKQEIVVEATKPLGEEENPEEMRTKYLDSATIVSE